MSLIGLGFLTVGLQVADAQRHRGAHLRPKAASAVASAPADSGKPDMTVLHVQVILDHLGFGPGVLDGRPGLSLKNALRGFQETRGLPQTGEMDAETMRALYPYRQWRPTRTLALDQATLTGPFINPLPKDPAEQAKLPALAYRDVMEALAERFHTTPQALVALNGPQTQLAPGVKVVFPNALPTSRDYKTTDAAWRATLNSLNVDANQPQGEQVEVSKSRGVLRVLDATGKLVAQFTATMGSSHDPLPIGTWKIQGVDHNPKFHFNPALFWDAKPGQEKALLPAGPNSPVGVVWIDLSKPHYGIHGTPSPETIGRAESHGCIRLTNWDAARLAMMIKPGAAAVFRP